MEQIKYYKRNKDTFTCIYLAGTKYYLFTVENCVGFNQFIKLSCAVELEHNVDIYSFKNKLNK